MPLDYHTIELIPGTNLPPQQDRISLGRLMSVTNSGGSAGAAVTTTITGLSLPAVQATGSVAFTTNPSNTNTITIAGTSVQFVTSGATGNQVNIGANTTATVLALEAFLQGSSDSNIIKFNSYNSVGTTLTYTATTPGTGGNSLTVSTTVSGATVNAMSGGSANYAVSVDPQQDATWYTTNRTAVGFQVVMTPRLAANSLAAGTFTVTIGA